MSPSLPPILQQFMDGEEKENNLGGGMVEIVSGVLDGKGSLVQKQTAPCGVLSNNSGSCSNSGGGGGSSSSGGGNLVNGGGARSKNTSRDSGDKPCVSFDPNPTILASYQGNVYAKTCLQCCSSIYFYLHG